MADSEEQRRIAEELGIDVEELTLKPTSQDLKALPPDKKSIQQSQLQAKAYPDSDHDNMTAQIALLTSPANQSNVRRQTYN